jgi:transposase
LSNGELYAIFTNKAKGGKTGSVVAIVKGTKAADVISVIRNEFLKEMK